jgi:GNAT superfamily N-acetyltransferase
MENWRTAAAPGGMLAGMDDLVISTLAERPELTGRLYDLADAWPPFMMNDPVANTLFHQVAVTFPAYSVVATLGGDLVARGRAVPFAFPVAERTELPATGWDRVMIWGISDHRHGIKPTAASALEIAIDAEHLGKGLSYVMLDALRDAVRAQGHDVLYAPVRPNGKTDPAEPMSRYIERFRSDGLPVDPWLRVHVRAGASVVKVAPASMVIPGSLAQWREWTGLPFDTDGDVHVPGALAPVHVDVAQDHAVYVEPNVWVRHDLA